MTTPLSKEQLEALMAEAMEKARQQVEDSAFPSEDATREVLLFELIVARTALYRAQFAVENLPSLTALYAALVRHQDAAKARANDVEQWAESLAESQRKSAEQAREYERALMANEEQRAEQVALYKKNFELCKENLALTQSLCAKQAKVIEHLTRLVQGGSPRGSD